MTRMVKAVVVAALWLSLGAAGARAGFIVNGDFSQGNTGFTSAYTYSPGDIGPAASYDVVDNPAHSRPHDISPVSYGDHTTGTGLMLAVNGATVPNVIFWSETVTVAANSDYNFDLWISSWFPTAPATVDVLFNGTSIGTADAPSTTAVWQQFSASWNSGASTSLTINLIDTNPADIGSDFALDDISLSGPSPTAVPAPASAVLLLSGTLALCLGAGARRFSCRRVGAGDRR